MSSHQNLIPGMIIRKAVVHAQAHFSRVWVYHYMIVKIIIDHNSSNNNSR